jgi:DNA-directed RNA polymerase specialized sigma24 family protein
VWNGGPIANSRTPGSARQLFPRQGLKFDFLPTLAGVQCTLRVVGTEPQLTPNFVLPIMTPSSSIRMWIESLKQGDKSAADKLWSEYVQRLVDLAKLKLGSGPRRAADEEDVAVQAFMSFCQGIEEGRFAKLDDADDLWQVLLMLTERKAIDQRRHERAVKRGGGTVRGGSAVRQKPKSEHDSHEWDQFASLEPTPEFAAQAAEEFHGLLELLGDELRCVAIDKLQGFENEEIAAKYDISLRTVERRLSRIRHKWSAAQPPTEEA